VTSESDIRPQLEARLREGIPGLRYERAELDDYGEDHQILTLDGAWVVRFARNIEDLARFGAELTLLEALRKVTPVAVPHYEFVAPDRSFGAYRRIAGHEMTPAVYGALDAGKQRRVLSALAGFLGALHRLPRALIAQPDGVVPRTFSGEQFAALYRAVRRARIARVVDGATLKVFDAFHEAFEEIEPGVPRLAHNDLSDDHILVRDDGALAGIIDFGDAAYGDPAIDFAWFWRLGEAAVDYVLAVYELAPEDPGLKDRAHWTFVRYLINQLQYGDSVKWYLTVDEALAELEPHLARLGF
jgi:aminoglycoside phosphotransferase (APT) family kinase protein